jgi:hypothetical protein
MTNNLAYVLKKTYFAILKIVLIAIFSNIISIK